MSKEQVDIAIVGGGIGGSALATMMSRSGFNCLVLEKTTEFEDRTSGEWIAPWGVQEAERLGLLANVLSARGHYRRRHVSFSPFRSESEANAATLDFETVAGGRPLAQRHPDLCQALVDAATAAGASTNRNVSEVEVELGKQPTVRHIFDGAGHQVRDDFE